MYHTHTNGSADIRIVLQAIREIKRNKENEEHQPVGVSNITPLLRAGVPTVEQSVVFPRAGSWQAGLPGQGSEDGGR
jgi:hypothetical protein